VRSWQKAWENDQTCYASYVAFGRLCVISGVVFLLENSDRIFHSTNAIHSEFPPSLRFVVFFQLGLAVISCFLHSAVNARKCDLLYRLSDVVLGVPFSICIYSCCVQAHSSWQPDSNILMLAPWKCLRSRSMLTPLFVSVSVSGPQLFKSPVACMWMHVFVCCFLYAFVSFTPHPQLDSIHSIWHVYNLNCFFMFGITVVADVRLRKVFRQRQLDRKVQLDTAHAAIETYGMNGVLEKVETITSLFETQGTTATGDDACQTRKRQLISTLQHSLSWVIFYFERSVVHRDVDDGAPVTLLHDHRSMSLRRVLHRSKTAFEAHAARAAAVSLEIRFDPKLVDKVIVQESLVWFCLNNLLSNSAKFTKVGFVSLKVRSVNRSNADLHMRFEVTDAGIGLSPGDEPLLFQRFNEPRFSKGKFGPGLGLYYMKQALQQAGGSCGFRWTKRTHMRRSLATFWFQVPVKSAADEAEEDQCAL